MEKIRIKSLTVPQLKEVLRAYDLSDIGLRNDLLERLVGHLGEEFLPGEVWNSIHRENGSAVETQISELKLMMENLAKTVAELSNSVNTHNPSNVQADDDNRSEIVESIERAGSVSEIDSIAHIESIPEDINTFSVKSNLRDIVVILPEFNPLKECLSARQFIDKINNLARAYGWADGVKLYAAQMKLEGHAKSWANAHDVFQTWSEFVDALLLDFPSEINTADIHIEMVKTNQTRNETVIDYYYKMLSIGRRGKLDDKSIIRHVINGLNDENMRRTLNTRHFEECSEFLKAITGIPIIKSASQPTYSNHSRVKSPYVNDVTPKTEKREFKPPVCYNCNEVGHISVNCPKPQKKKRCPSCNKVHATGESTDCGKKTTTSRRMQVGDHMFTKKVLIDDVEWVAFVDTGSQCSMVRRAIADKISGNKERCKLTIKGIGGGRKDVDELIQTILHVDDIQVTVILYIVDDDMMEEDLLLGQDIFSNYQMKAIVEQGNLTFKTARAEIKDDKFIKPQHEGLNEEDYQKLTRLLNTYADRFAVGLKDIGKTDLVTLKIEVDTEIPIAQAPYRVPYPKRPVIINMVNDLLEADIIQRSESEYASPITLVKKHDGSDRLCVDYRRLNQHVRKEIYPMPNIEERLQDAKQFVMFTSLDLNSGYYQIEVEKESQKYTAFVTTEGLYEFKRMPFGLRNAPMAFQRLMAKFNDMLLPTDMIHYMDDILIGANNQDEMLAKLQRVLEALRSAGLTLNPNKCSFFTKTISFLGHRLTASGIEPGEIKTRAIANFKAPTTITEVRRFLGLSGYFRKFVPGYALISEPIRRLLRKDEPFLWTDVQEKAFEELKLKLINGPVLVAYDVDAEHQLHTDASSIGVAAVLMQKTNDGWKPVAYYSRSTSLSEKKMHSYELETLAVVEGLDRFRYYVYGKTLTVVTDCSAVAAALKKKELVPRIARWWLRIQDYDLKMEHRAEVRMCHVDALSRMPDEEPNTVETASLRIDRVDITEHDWLMTMQLQDENLQQLVTKIRNNDKQAKTEFVLENGRLLKRLDTKNLYVVPKALRYKIVMDAHEKNGHLSVDRTIEKIQQLMWFPRMRNFVKACLKSCVECAYNKTLGGRHEGEYHFSDVEAVPFKVVHVDHLGPFPKSSKRNEHIVVLVDAFTKYVCMKAVPSTATKHVIKMFDETSSWVGMPECLISDRGTSYTSNEFKRYCEQNAIRHVLNAVRTPRANGQVERMNRTILSMLLPLAEKSNKWDERLRQIQWSINNAKNATTQRSPYELLFGYQPRDILANKLALVLHDLNTKNNPDEDRLETLVNTRSDAVQKIMITREKAKERYDKNHATPKQYICGDLVLVTNEAVSTGTSRKLEPKFKGPFMVTKVLDNDRYVVEDIPGAQRSQRHYSSVYASDSMKSWCSLPPEVINDQDVIGEDTEIIGWPTVKPTDTTDIDN